jgi:hypothetical protein
VLFEDATNRGAATNANLNTAALLLAANQAKVALKLCNPSGNPGLSTKTNTLAQNQALYSCGPIGATCAAVAAPVTTNGVFAGTMGIGVTGNSAAGNNAAFTGDATAAPAALANPVTTNVGEGFWDPILAAQITGGAMCCDALYYGEDAMGRGTINGVPALGSYSPTPFQGVGTMASETSPGGQCSQAATSSSTSDIVGVSNIENPTETLLLEGQAFYAVMAPTQFVLPKDAAKTTAVQTANAARQNTCSRTLTQMLKMNQFAAGRNFKSGKSLGSGGTDATTTATCRAPTAEMCTTATSTFPGAQSTGGQTPCTPSGAGTAATADAFCDGLDYSPIENPLWPVAIGTGGTPNKYIVPSGYCYANACFNDYVDVAFKTDMSTKLASLIKSPDMNSNPSSLADAFGSCGRANKACAAPPTGWSGAAAKFEKCTAVTGGKSVCSDNQKKAQIGYVPTV